MADKRTVWEVLIQLSAKGLKQVKKQLDGVKQRTSGLRSAQDKSQKSMNAFARRAYEQRQALEQTGKAHGQLGNQMDRTGKSSDQLKSKSGTLFRALSVAGAGAIRMMRGLDEERFQSLAGTAAGASRTFTLMSMAMLGVYYSTMSLVQGYGTLFNAVLSPLRRMEQTVKSVAMYWALTGKESDPTLIGRFVDAWLGLQTITGALMEGMMELAASVWEVAGDDILRNVEKFAEALGDDDMVDAVSGLAIALSEALPDVAKMVVWIARLMESTSGLTRYLLLLSMVALTLMPIFAIISGVMQTMRVAFLIAGTAAAHKTIAIGALSLALWKFMLIALAIVGVLYLIHRAFNSNLDIIGMVFKAISTLLMVGVKFNEFLTNIFIQLGRINPMMKIFADFMKKLTGTQYEVARSFDDAAESRRREDADTRGVASRTMGAITNFNQFNVEDKVDWENETERLGIN